MNFQEINPSQIYQYFNECYKLDYKEFIVDNILSMKYKYKWFVNNKEELLNEELPYIPYDNPKMDELEKEMELYKLDKQLFYTCFFVLGKSDNPIIKDNRISAPLFLFPANIITIDNLKFLEIDSGNFVINRSVLSKFELGDSKFSKEDFINDCTELLSSQTVEETFWLKGLIDKYFCNVETEELLYTPYVWGVSKLRSYFKDKEIENGCFTIVPGAGTVWVDKSQASLGVLNDLNQLKSRNEYNTSQSFLLKGKEPVFTADNSILKYRLNEQQHKAVQNAISYYNSIIIGPPGTGKSYTITSLVADAVVNNKSVLVVSKTKQAVEVIREMLERDFKLKNHLVHTTGNKYKISLKAKIQKLLAGMSVSTDAYQSERYLVSLYDSLNEKENSFLEFIQKELKLSDIEFSVHARLFDKWRKHFIKMKMGNGQKVWQLYGDIEKYNNKLNTEIETYCKRKINAQVCKFSKVYRKDIAILYDALDASCFSESKEIGENVNYKNILKVFPIWLANLSDLNSVLPLQKDLFDLVVIDEATQCDVASALPAIYRAKSVVISGDPNQLKHYSFVSRNQQKDLLRKYNLPTDKIFDYRERSILDIYLNKIERQDQVTFLKEHFRSTPSLIEFSNQHFYGGQLEILKSLPEDRNSSQIELIEVGGERDKKGIHEEEARAVLKKMDEVIKKYSALKEVPGIGVISLFSSQSDYLNKLIKEKYDLETLKRFNILCGSPYVFQGNEREIIFLSFALGNNSHHSAFIHANKPEVLNVAVTRAKSFQYVFKSVDDQKLDKDSLIASYFSFIKGFANQDENRMGEDNFQLQIVNVLKNNKIDHIYCGYPLGGCLLDILVINNKGVHFFIDLIGYPGLFKESFTLERYKTLSRMGIRIIPLHYSFWKDYPTLVAEMLCKKINN